MNKKILIGSIIAAAILIMVSFTGVVGYQTTKSSTIAKASPLFNIRTSRAIDRDSEDLSCDYVGKGVESNILFPKQDERTILIQKVIELISNMGNKEFNEFKDFIKNQKFWENSIKYEGLTDNIIIREKFQTNVITICYWVPNCILTRIFATIAIVLGVILLILDAIFEQFTLGPCGKCGPYQETMHIR